MFMGASSLRFNDRDGKNRVDLWLTDIEKVFDVIQLPKDYISFIAKERKVREFLELTRGARLLQSQLEQKYPHTFSTKSEKVGKLIYGLEKV